MERQHIQTLVEKFNAGHVTDAEIQEIEKLIEQGMISLTDLHDLRQLDEQVVRIEEPAPSFRLDDTFYRMLRQEKADAARSYAVNWKKIFSWPELVPRLSFAAVALVIGIVAGYIMRSPSPAVNDSQINALSQQVTDLKEMMMLSLLEKESASDRLKAVSLTEEMDRASQKVTEALLETLTNDSNVNVRLAALEALTPYARDSHVRQELIHAIARQESPLVQIALAELMAALQEKSSVTELQKILKDRNTPRDVKKKIEESIDVLI
jgi:uncharacterized protein (UPF0147 family)